MTSFSFGLIGKRLSHSFSKDYFESKFSKLRLPFDYSLFELPTIDLLPVLLASDARLLGLNVTIPYKEMVLPFLAGLDPGAAGIGAVNTLVKTPQGWVGHNTDVLGFAEALESLAWWKGQPHRPSAMVLGTGGAAKAVMAALRKLGVTDVRWVSRSPQTGQIDYGAANALLDRYTLIIDATPLGTFPDVQSCPPLAFDRLGATHLYYDLTYNPAQTVAMQRAQAAGASTENGLKMLHAQAEAAWQIWQVAIEAYNAHPAGQ
jgi:shikimate dehydrogenase